jgi:hypothetical protein
MADLLEELQTIIAEKLTMPGAVAGLARNGQAAQAVALIAQLNPDQQTTVLTQDNALRNLTDNGQAEQIVALIAQLKPDQQATVLARPSAVKVLGWNGQYEAVSRLQDGLARRPAPGSGNRPSASAAKSSPCAPSMP